MRARALITQVVAACLLLTGSAIAANVGGSSGDDELAGTKHGDTIRGDAGDDSLTGRAGDDTLIGGLGADTLRGGSGFDLCRTDAEDPAPVGCEDASGPAGPLRVTNVTGTDRCIILRRAESCYFVIDGGGANESAGTVAGSGAVEVTPPTGEVTFRNGRWSANGIYSCAGNGALVVTIGAESATEPVDCPG